jgi:nucleoside-diphosphate-sugar epimerase
MTMTIESWSRPHRVVVLGARGFVGGAIAARAGVDGQHVLAIGSADLDLTAPTAAERLAAQLTADDALVIVSAKAPARTVTLLAENVRMIENVCAALTQRSVDRVLYISSDAVYADDAALVSEATPASGHSLHGQMHNVREAMLRHTVKGPFAVLRPTLLYGARDPHNGYGPNRFRRLAAEGKPIELFGEGEELRDHVFIDDLAELALRVIAGRGQGVLNIATGTSVSFRQAAELAVALFGPQTPVRGTERRNPVTHRHFDPTAAIRLFPDFQYTPLAAGLQTVRRQLG